MTGAPPETKVDALRELAKAITRRYLCVDEHTQFERISGDIASLLAQHITLAQQAAYERAAQAAEEMNTVSASQADGLRDPRIVALDIAKEIRSLGSASALDGKNS